MEVLYAILVVAAIAELCLGAILYFRIKGRK